MHRNTVAVVDWDGRANELATSIAASPFTRVVLTVEDRHVQWRSQNVIEAVEAFHTAGIEVVVDPWGVGGLFAGETFGDTRNPQQAIRNWLKLAALAKADGILWDEPHNPDILDGCLDQAQFTAPELYHMLALQPERNLEHWGKDRRVAELSLSAYFWPPRILRETEETLLTQVEQWAARLPANGTAWVQNWGLPEGTEGIPAALIRCWRQVGHDVNVWAWDGFRSVSEMRPVNFEQVWAQTIAACQP